MDEIIISNIMQIADIESTQLSEEAQHFFKKRVTSAWRDQLLHEHIFNWEDINQEDHDLTTKLSKELVKINNAVDKANCSYFRITYQ